MAWTEILDQPLAVRILQRHLAQARVAPVYLFTGPDGVGKRRVAMELAQALNCVGPAPQPCGACEVCQRISRRVHPDVHELAPEGPKALISIDTIRQLLARVGLRPYSARCSIVVLEGADRLTEEAANSVLKFLEEPAERTRVIVTTTAPWRCLPTITSRCQRIRFAPLRPETVVAWLEREQRCDRQQAETISRLADGSLARAVEFVDEWDFHQRMWTQFASPEPMAWLMEALPQDRQELAAWLAGSVRWMRDLAVASVGADELVAHREALEAIAQHSRQPVPEEYADAVLRVMALWDSSSEQMVSSRLVGTLLREEWLALISDQ